MICHALHRVIPGLSDEAVLQASLRCHNGGLGIAFAQRTAQAASLAAFIAAEPILVSMAGDLDRA
eukprot:5411228-Amphidinium_carterae.1